MSSCKPFGQHEAVHNSPICLPQSWLVFAGGPEAWTAQQPATDLANTADDDLIIQAAAKAPYSPDSALQDLNAADKLQPGDYATLQMRGLVRADLNDIEGALQDLEGRADTWYSLLRRASCHIMLGHIDKARADVLKAAGLQPGGIRLFCDEFDEHVKVLIGTAEEPARLTQQLRQPRELVASLRGRQTSRSQVCLC